MTPRRPSRVFHKKSVRKPPMAMFALGMLLLAYSTAAAPPSILTGPASDMFASSIVSMSAGVEQNPDNVLAAKLAQKEAELEAREASLSQGGAVREVKESSLPVYTFGLSIILFILVLLNYYRDWRRDRREQKIAVS